MKKITIAKVNLDGQIFYVTPCNVLENEVATTMKKIDQEGYVPIEWFCGFTILNNTKSFQHDIERIISKILSGEKLKYYQGDFDKYYFSSDKKIKDLYDALEAKA